MYVFHVSQTHDPTLEWFLELLENVHISQKYLNYIMFIENMI